MVVGPRAKTRVHRHANGKRQFKTGLACLLRSVPNKLTRTIGITRPFLNGTSFTVCLNSGLVRSPLRDFIRAFATRKLSTLVLLRRIPGPATFKITRMSSRNQIIQLMRGPTIPPSSLTLIKICIFSTTVRSTVARVHPSTQNRLRVASTVRRLVSHRYPIRTYRLDN